MWLQQVVQEQEAVGNKNRLWEESFIAIFSVSLSTSGSDTIMSVWVWSANQEPSALTFLGWIAWSAWSTCSPNECTVLGDASGVGREGAEAKSQL